MMYDPELFTYGLELELGDVERRLPIPPHLGEWEYAECDIVNLRPPFRYRAVDPLGVHPPVGGEVNVMPSKTIPGLMENVRGILGFFEDNGCPGTANCISHTHVHVHVPGLIEDIESLKRVAQCVYLSQQEFTEKIHAFREMPGMNQTKASRTYLRWDGGRPIADWLVENLMTAKDFDDFIRIYSCGKDGVSRGRPLRYMLNLYCLKHTQTVEFRFFRHTVDPQEIENCVICARDFLDYALNNPDAVNKGFTVPDLQYPPFRYDQDQCNGWEATKYGSKRRGKKNRKYIPLDGTDNEQDGIPGPDVDGGPTAG